MAETIRPKDIISLRAQARSRSVAASELPLSITAAYDTAAATLGLLGQRTAAWKLGATTASTRRTFATGEIYFGALLDSEVWDVSQTDPPPTPPQLRGEAEIAFRLALDISCEGIRSALSRPSAELFDAWAPAIECPYSCVDNIPEAGLRALLMDRCAAGALYLGQPGSDIEDSAMEQTLEILADGVIIAQGAAKTSLLMPPIEAARGFLGIAADQGVGVRKGQWISTGGITLCVPLPFGRLVQLNLGGKKAFSLVVQAPAS